LESFCDGNKGSQRTYKLKGEEKEEEIWVLIESNGTGKGAIRTTRGGAAFLISLG